MRNLCILMLAAWTAGLAAQANVVTGLDGRLTVVDNPTYFGRRGAAYPNGEIGMSMLCTTCNAGTVNIPWYPAMQSNHAKFGFLIARVLNDRIEQINDRSFCKHAFLANNSSGACGPCQHPGTGALMGVHCTDTCDAGNNASRIWLGPPAEIDPWLGTWNPLGSYFDIGDPAQAGYPAPADGNRSLSQSIFDSVDNRVTVKEIDLTSAGASYYYALQLIHEGEAAANRGDNNAHRGMIPNWNGSAWSFANSTEAQAYGSVLDRWTGAQVHVGQNGNDDGRFYVASKVTSIGGGSYHYEYAVHNVDNRRAGGALRVPIDAGGIATNFRFGDIDTDGGNDWTAVRIGNEIVFSAPASNGLEWNTFYNFGFDADVAPGDSRCTIAAHRPGSGAAFVHVQAQTPSATTYATVASVGTGCGGTISTCIEALYEESFDLANSSFTLAYSAGEYTLVPGAGSWIAPTGLNLGLGDESESTQPIPFSLPYPGGSTNSLAVCSNGFVSPASNGTSYFPNRAEFLSGGARWAGLWHDLDPQAGGDVRFDADASRVVVTYDGVNNYAGGGTVNFQLQFWANGDVHFVYQNVAIAGNGYLVGYSVGGGVADPGATDLSASLQVGLSICSSAASSVPNILLTASDRPVVHTVIDLIASNVPLTSVGGLSILSVHEFVGGIDLTFLGMPGCFAYQDLGVVELFPVAGGMGQRSFTLPNNAALVGGVLYSQAAILDLGINAFNVATSNGLALSIGSH